MTSNKSDGIPQNQINLALQRQIKSDPYLAPYKDLISRRLVKIAETRQRLTRQYESLADFASGHEYFGLHFKDNQWVFREWAPNATAVYLVGDFCGWKEDAAFGLTRLGSRREAVRRITPNHIGHVHDAVADVQRGDDAAFRPAAAAVEYGDAMSGQAARINPIPV